MRARIFDAAGATDDYLYVWSDDPQSSSIRPERLVFNVYSGTTLVRDELRGAFNGDGSEGTIAEIRQTVDGDLHFRVTFDDRVRLQNFYADLDAATQDGGTVTGNRSANRIVAFDGGDVLTGRGGADRLFGVRGDDRIDGGSGSDRLFGGVGDDAIEGGSGGDRLFGGRGSDRLTGDAGADAFVFRATAESRRGADRDVITDFRAGVDRIALTAIDANENRDGDQAFFFIADDAFSDRAGELRYDGGVLRADTDGDGRSDFELRLRSAPDAAQDDFLL